MLVIIAAAGENNGLGKENSLVWHLPDDFKRFKQLTTGHKIIMGRKTFESFPKPLPNRTHIIISRDIDYKVPYPECSIVHSIADAIKMADKELPTYIIGGGEIYRQSMPYADKIELTRVHEAFDADTYFPKIDENEWLLVQKEHHPKDARHAYGFTYLTYIRKIALGKADK